MLYYKIGKLVSLKKNVHKVISITFENANNEEYDTWMLWYRFKSTINTSPWIQNFLKYGKQETVSLNSTRHYGKNIKTLGIRITGNKNLYNKNFGLDASDYMLEGIPNNLEGFEF